MEESTTQTPPDKLPKYIPDRDKLCLSKEQAEHVYEAVENGEQVKPLSVNSSVDKQFPVVNPYTIGLSTNTDSSLKKEPSLEMKKCDLTWSILSTVVDYTECDKNSPYKEVNYSPVYSRFTDTKDLVHCKVLLLAFRWSLFLCVLLLISLQLCQRSLFLWLCINVYIL